MRHARVVGHAAQRLVAQDAAGVEIGAQELRRMRAQRQAQEAVVVDHFLAQRHGRKRHVGLARCFPHLALTPPPRGRVGVGVASSVTIDPHPPAFACSFGGRPPPFKGR